MRLPSSVPENRPLTSIGVSAGGALVERVSFRGYGTGRHPDTGSSRECFVVHQTLVYKDRTSCRRAAGWSGLRRRVSRRCAMASSRFPERARTRLKLKWVS